jgi:hypothetical protein
MVSVIFTSGNTITITAKYYNGILLSDLDASPTVTLYDSDETTVIGTSGTASHIGIGDYTYEITLPTGTGAHIYYAEFAGLSSGKPIVGRTQINSAFVSS